MTDQTRGGARLRCILLGLALAGCQADRTPGQAALACQFPGQTKMTELKLYFGRGIPGGGYVDDAAWKDFASRELTPAFPEGFTVYETLGQWRSVMDGAIKRERSFVVERLGPLDQAVVQRVISAYRTQFHQESVLLVTSEKCAAF